MHEWMDRSACRGHDPEMFFPEVGNAPATARKAMAVCNGCPVLAECGEFRKQIRAYTGVWHGHWYRSAAPNLELLRPDAVLMHEEGMTMTGISDELGVPVWRVKRWVGGSEQHVG